MRSRIDRLRVWLAPLVVFCVIMLVFGAFWVFLRQAERHERLEVTQLTADRAAHQLESFIATRLQLVESLRRVIRSSPDGSLASYRARVDEYHEMLDGIVAINWVDAEGVIREVSTLR